jgi:hypothetical protein
MFFSFSNLEKIAVTSATLYLALASHGFTGSKMSPQPATASGRLIQVAADCPPCPSHVPPDGYNQGH